MEQTALEWLEDNIDRDMPYIEILMLIKQAKEMEKQKQEKTIGFTDWLRNDCEKYNEYLYKIKSVKELFKIYKQEKGL